MRPYVICHTVMSIDGKVTGDFLSHKKCEKPKEIYSEINPEMKCKDFICGKIAMWESRTKGFYPDLSAFSSVTDKNDYIADSKTGFYAVAFDPKGKLGWKSAFIEVENEGYKNTQIVEVVSEQVDKKYLSYLKSLGISYIIAGKTEIDVNVALQKLRLLFGIECILLEGGSLINRYFQKAGVIDELSIVTAPVIAGKDGSSLFYEADFEGFEFYNSKIFEDGAIWLNYKKEGYDSKKEYIRQKIIINWSERIPFEDALLCKETDIQGLYYITREINRKDKSPKETSLYIGIATNGNTVKNRLKAHKKNWTGFYNGKKYVRVGEIVYPKLYYKYDEALIIEHAESAILNEEEHKNLFPENIDKRNCFSYYDLYEIENRGNDIGELKRTIIMNAKKGV